MVTPPDERDPLAPDPPDETSGWREPPPPPEIPAVLREPAPTLSKPGGQAPRDAGLGGVARAWATALDFVFTILAGIGLGWLVGRWQGHVAPWAIGGLVVGFVAAFVRIVRATRRQELAEQHLRETHRRDSIDPRR